MFSRVIRLASPIAFQTQKISTGLTGLEVHAKPREALQKLYGLTLQAIQDVPPSAGYRAAVEQITNYRLNVVNQNEDITTIEKIIGTGQVEELIEQAKDELKLIPDMIKAAPWDVPPNHPRTKIVILGKSPSELIKNEEPKPAGTAPQPPK
eukprot:TRINITY_DN4342_c0_g1_i1.p1 TRINITY_DN4342_c0_g1~~TRINITY_DN4342_c0_g1_i1.p1  ORF type:complete len:151 (+),score=36.82 TRINITY_DN4342_c0_g1_i1:134-586(+)